MIYTQDINICLWLMNSMWEYPRSGSWDPSVCLDGYWLDTAWPLKVKLRELPDLGKGYLTKYQSKFKSEHRYEKVIFRRARVDYYLILKCDILVAK